MIGGSLHSGICYLWFYFHYQWPMSQALYAGLRIIFAVLAVSGLVYALYVTPWVHYGHPLAVYLTSWAYTLLVLYQLWSAVVVLLRTYRGDLSFPWPPPVQNRPPYNIVTGTDKPIDWDVRLLWLLFILAANITLFVTIIYFTMVFPKQMHKMDIVNIQVHALNSLTILDVLLFSAIPVRILHAIYPILFGVVYVIFSVVYWALDKPNHVIYPSILDWNQLTRTLSLVALFLLVVVPVLQLLLFGLYRLRIWLYRACGSSNNIVEASQTPPKLFTVSGGPSGNIIEATQTPPKLFTVSAGQNPGGNMTEAMQTPPRLFMVSSGQGPSSSIYMTNNGFVA